METLLQEGSSQLHGLMERAAQEQPTLQVCADPYDRAVAHMAHMATPALHN